MRWNFDIEQPDDLFTRPSPNPVNCEISTKLILPIPPCSQESIPVPLENFMKSDVDDKVIAHIPDPINHRWHGFSHLQKLINLWIEPLFQFQSTLLCWRILKRWLLKFFMLLKILC
mmetsp:Transcript_20648/g.58975  ORF Transcript_20648/g.58975 Transcript_20648/m.58975 type:complete len:116 (-) Transcript_20648:344-691(-)